MKHWGRDILFTRRSLIAGAAGLLVAQAASARTIATPRQTAGPFYPFIKPLDADADLTLLKGSPGPAKGEVIEVTGRIFALNGAPLEGAVVEIWQADSNGRYDHILDFGSGTRDENFQGYGAVRADDAGGYLFRTIRPKFYDTGIGQRTPHIHFRVTAEAAGELVTQMYFPGEQLNGQDFVLQGLESDAARAAVTARAEESTVPRYGFDLVLG